MILNDFNGLQRTSRASGFPRPIEEAPFREKTASRNPFPRPTEEKFPLSRVAIALPRPKIRILALPTPYRRENEISNDFNELRANRPDDNEYDNE